LTDARSDTLTESELMTAKFSLFTLDYKRMTTDLGTAVRTSNGAPRWKLKYPLDHAVREVMPEWALVKAKLPHEEFAAKYVDALTKVGVDVIADRFRAIAAGVDDTRLVLLCFDDLSKPGVTCHRTVFARWWESMTGENVVELGPTGPVPTPQEPGLF
jgi:hypothetical protein